MFGAGEGMHVRERERDREMGPHVGVIIAAFSDTVLDASWKPFWMVFVDLGRQVGAKFG